MVFIPPHTCQLSKFSISYEKPRIISDNYQHLTLKYDSMHLKPRSGSLSSIVILATEIQKKLESLDMFKSAGPDKGNYNFSVVQIISPSQVLKVVLLFSMPISIFSNLLVSSGIFLLL